MIFILSDTHTCILSRNIQRQKRFSARKLMTKLRMEKCNYSNSAKADPTGPLQRLTFRDGKRNM